MDFNFFLSILSKIMMLMFYVFKFMEFMFLLYIYNFNLYILNKRNIYVKYFINFLSNKMTLDVSTNLPLCATL